MITKILVDDKNNPGKQIALERYVIEKEKNPIAVIFGKFSPWTGGDLEYGHGRLIKTAKQNGIKEFYVVSPKRDETDDNSANLFSASARKQIIEHSLKNVPGFLGVVQSDSNNIMGVIKHITHLVSRPVFVVGPDRERLLKTNFVQFNSAPVTNQNEKDFGKPECLVLTGERETSGTKVRQSIQNDDFKTFSKLTNHSEEMFRFMKKLTNQKNESFTGFYTNIFEGGNLRIGTNKANKIDLLSAEYDVEELKIRIKNMLSIFVSSLSNTEFWNHYIKLIDSNEIFSGSSKHFFEKSVDEFSKVKKTVGDIDIQFPFQYEEELDTLIKSSTGKQFGDMILLGQGGKSPIQINTLFTDNITGLNIQIDFEPVNFKEKFPTEFARFSRSSAWSDLNENIKGVFHKYLLRALVGSTKINNIYVVTSYDSKKNKWRVSKKDYEGTNLQGFSVDKGVRVKYERARNSEGEEYFVDSLGQEWLEQEPGTKPAYVETDTKTYDYIKDVNSIAVICFGKELDATEMEMFSSFLGCLKLIEKYVRNKEEIYSAFFELIFGRNAQEIEQGEFVDGINKNDFDVKFAAYSKMRNVLDMNELPEIEVDSILDYYSELKAKK